MVVVLVVALVGGGLVLVLKVIGGSNLEAAELVPASAVAYVEFTIDPGAAQKVEAARLLNRLTDDAPLTIDEDPAEAQRDAAQYLLDELCPDIDYADDIEPWLGDSLAFALLGGGSPIVVVHTTGAEASEAGLDDLFGCVVDHYGAHAYQFSDDLDLSDIGVAHNGNWAVIAASAKDAERFLDEADEESLADDPEFIDALAELGDLGFITAWFSGARAAELADAHNASSDTVDALEELYASAVATLRVDGDVLEVAGSVSGNFPDISPAGYDATTLPDDIVMATYWSGIGDSVGGLLLSDHESAFTGWALAGVPRELALRSGLPWPITSFDFVYPDLEVAGTDDFLLMASTTPEYPWSDENEPTAPDDCRFEENGRVVLTNNADLVPDAPHLKPSYYEEELEGDLDWNALYDSQLYDAWLNDFGYPGSFEAYVHDHADPDEWILHESYSYCSTGPADPIDEGDLTAWSDGESFADDVLGQSGTLGESSVFRAVVPDAADKDLFTFWGRDQLEHQKAGLADVVEAVGYSMDQGPGRATFSLRVLVAN